MDMEKNDLEQECEDAVFELCDVRERFPTKCADELEDCLRLTSHINMKPVRSEVAEKVQTMQLTNEQENLIQQVIPQQHNELKARKLSDNKINELIKTTKNLKSLIEMIKRNPE